MFASSLTCSRPANSSLVPGHLIKLSHRRMPPHSQINVVATSKQSTFQSPQASCPKPGRDFEENAQLPDAWKRQHKRKKTAGNTVLEVLQLDNGRQGEGTNAELRGLSLIFVFLREVRAALQDSRLRKHPPPPPRTFRSRQSCRMSRAG